MFHILYDPLYMKYPEEINLEKQKADWGLLGAAGNGVFFQGDDNLLEIEVMVAEHCEHTKYHPVVCVEIVNSMLGEFHLNK